MHRSQRRLGLFGLSMTLGLACGLSGCAEMKSSRQNDDSLLLGKIEEPAPKTTRRSGGMASAPVGAASDAGPTPKLSLDTRLDNPKNRQTEGTTIVANRSTAPPARISLGAPLPVQLPQVNIEPLAAGSMVAVSEVALDKPRELKVDARVITPESLVTAARNRVEGLTSYKVAMNRQEKVGENLQPAEDLILSVRRNPKAVRFEWPSGPSKGREVIFESADGLMHINTPGSMMPRLDLAPDNFMVARNSRHPITEAGFDTIIANLESSLTGPPANRSQYEGKETPEAIGRVCHKLTRVGTEGERWLVYLDDQTKLPAMVQEESAHGELLERYIFRNVEANPAELTLATAFDPDSRWGRRPGGLLSRIAQRPASSSTPANSAETTTR